MKKLKCFTGILIFIFVIALSAAVHAAGHDIIVDNTAANGTGVWITNGASGNKYGTDYKYIGANKTDSEGEYISYRPNISTAGKYNIYYWLPNGASNRSTKVEYVVISSEGEQTYYVDQRNAKSGQWILLGTHNFERGVGGEVRILNKLEPDDSAAYVNADAIKFEYSGNSDDFESGSNEDWKVRGGNWKIVTDTNGNHLYTNEKAGNSISLLDSGNQFVCEGSAAVKFDDTDSNAIAGIMSYRDSNNFYYFRIEKDTRNICLYKRYEGQDRRVALAVDKLELKDDFYNLSYEFIPTADGRLINCYIDGNKLISYSELKDNIVYTGGMALRSVNCSAVYDDISYTVLMNEKTPLSASLKEYDMDLNYMYLDCIENDSYKIEFYQAEWDTGSGIVPKVFSKENGELISICDDLKMQQWIVFYGMYGDCEDYYSSLASDYIAFDKFTKIDEHTVKLSDSSKEGRYSFAVRWSVDTANPKVSIELYSDVKENYVVSYQGFSEENNDLAAIDEVICGIECHAKMVGTKASTGVYKLTAPVSLIEKEIHGRQYTYGLFADRSSFDYKYETGDLWNRTYNQEFGMSLVNGGNHIQPIIFAPQFGNYSLIGAGETYRFTFGIYAKSNTAYEAYKSILEEEYSYTDYRQNVYDTSLTEAVYNMIDLLMIEPDGDDSVEFISSPSGWWSRAKGFADIESDKTAKHTSYTSLLSAYYLTGDRQIYDKRALPIIEFALSRNSNNWTPEPGKNVYGNTTRYKMLSTPWNNISQFSTLYDMTRRKNSAMYNMAKNLFWVGDNPEATLGNVINPLMMYRMSGNTVYLDMAKTNADEYIAKNIDTAYTKNVVWGVPFTYDYSGCWTEILELYEETGEKKYLDAAYKEAKRYITQIISRPEREGVETTSQEQILYALYDRWNPKASYDYPRKFVPEDTKNGGNAETAESWIMSLSGLTYEQGATSINYRMNLAEAPFIARLGMYKDDELFKNIAHNMVIGRFSNYPGYYYREKIVSHMKPDYPILGPSESNAIYYHHIPSQLGYAIDYLITEQMEKSNQNIEFPSVYETNYEWFKYHAYGHASGKFYGNDNVWLWMPKSIIDVNNSQINYITAESGDKFYISLVNESDTDTNVDIQVNKSIIDYSPSHHIKIIQDNGIPINAEMKYGKIAVNVSKKGITAIIVEDMNIDVKLHADNGSSVMNDNAYYINNTQPFDGMKAMLIEKPDKSGYDAYIETKKETGSFELCYSTDGGKTFENVKDSIYPYEWSVSVEDTSKPFTFCLKDENGERTLWKSLYLAECTSSEGLPNEADTSNVIVDDMSASVSKNTGWQAKTERDNYFSDRYLETKLSSVPQTVTYWPDIINSGQYEVYCWLPQGNDELTKNAEYKVNHANGSDIIKINQQIGSGDWILIGKWYFNANDYNSIELSAVGNVKTKMVADAIKLVAEPRFTDIYGQSLSINKDVDEVVYHPQLPQDIIQADVIAAVYSKEGILLGVSIKRYNEYCSDMSVSVKIPKDAEHEFHVKGYVFESINTLKPLVSSDIWKT